MRKLLALVVVLASSTARAEDKTIDVGPMAEKLGAYKDPVGNVYVVPLASKLDASKADDTSDAQKWFFFGDGKTMYQQQVYRFTPGKGGFDASLQAPRAKDMAGGYLVLNSEGSYLACRPAKVAGGRRELTALTADETKTLLGKAKFVPPLPARMPHFLARDDDANYYYIDRLPSESGGKGYRVFLGQTGAMKQLAMTNMATDSMGQIFATKSGKLKITAGKDPQAFWIKGNKKLELTVVPPDANRYLVFRELGIYGSLGTVCDDQ